MKQVPWLHHGSVQYLGLLLFDSSWWLVVLRCLDKLNLFDAVPSTPSSIEHAG
jgi:hypothetical protein